MGSTPITSTNNSIIINCKAIKTSKFFKNSKNQKNRLNEAIRISPVMVIDESGKKLGIMETSKAIEIAQEKGLDLVEIAPNLRPPVCRILDWGKFQYQQAKKQQKSKNNQKKIDIKGIRIRPTTGENDLNFKANQKKKFLAKGHKIKIEIILKGREKAFQNEAKEKLQSFIDKIDLETKIEQDISRQFNGFYVLIAPQK